MQKRIYLTALVTLLTVILAGCGGSTEISQEAVHDGPNETPVIKKLPIEAVSDETRAPEPLEEPGDHASDEADLEPQELPGDNEVAQDSVARNYAQNVNTVPDFTTSEALFVQMPNDIQPEMSRNGTSRTYSWTFSDGSKMVATFKPLGAEGSGQGLVLSMIDIKD